MAALVESLKDKSPASLLKLKAEMLAAVDKGPARQARAVRAYEARIAGVVTDVGACGADPQAVAQALGELTGDLTRQTGDSSGSRE